MRGIFFIGFNEMSSSSSKLRLEKTSEPTEERRLFERSRLTNDGSPVKVNDSMWAIDILLRVRLESLFKPWNEREYISASL